MFCSVGGSWTDNCQKKRQTTFQRNLKNVPGEIPIYIRFGFSLGRLYKLFEKWFVVFLHLSDGTLTKKNDKPLFEEILKTSQGKSQSISDSDSPLDVYKNSSKSGLSFFFAFIRGKMTKKNKRPLLKIIVN